jgi:hypothetical protein
MIAVQAAAIKLQGWCCNSIGVITISRERERVDYRGGMRWIRGSAKGGVHMRAGVEVIIGCYDGVRVQYYNS